MTAEQIKKSQWLGRIYFIKLRMQSLFSLRQSDEACTESFTENLLENGNKLSEQCCEILDTIAKRSEEKYVEMFRLYAEVRKEIEAAIDLIDNMEYQAILSAHYLEGKTWEKISEEMFYSIRSVKYKHLKALEQLKI